MLVMGNLEENIPRMVYSWNQKRILVTGSSRGIGRGIADYFVGCGATVGINGRNPNQVDSVCREHHGFIPIVGDVSTRSGAHDVVQNATQQMHGLDVLICNVGSGKIHQPDFETLQDWDTMMAQNFYSALYPICEALPNLVQSSGTIVCVSSICGVESVPGAPTSYSVAKSALNTFVRAVSRDFALKGVRINAVLPGNIMHKNSVWSEKLERDSVAVASFLKTEVPLQRLGEISEIVAAVEFLASGKSSFTTGSLLVVDGGQQRNY